jgi:hypothetical protein
MIRTANWARETREFDIQDVHYLLRYRKIAEVMA